MRFLKAAAWSFTNSTRQWLVKANVHVMGVHVGFVDTDLTQSLDIAKISPHTVAQHVFDGIQQNAFEVLVGESTQQLKQGLTANRSKLYQTLIFKYLPSI